MEVGVKTLLSSLAPAIKTPKEIVDFPKSFICPQIIYLGGLRNIPRGDTRGRCSRSFVLAPLQAVSAAVDVDVDDASDVSTCTEGSEVTVNNHDGREIKIRVNASGAKTQSIFDDVFSKMVTAAQPIPGFRRVKGVVYLLSANVLSTLRVLFIYLHGGHVWAPSGKTPDIPKDILLHILGPSKVNRQAIKKIVNSTVAAYVEKEGLKVTKGLIVDESFEELEATFEPGEEFKFNATIQLAD